jgi:excisionase family DNA binding protein
MQTPKMVFEASDVASFCETDVATIYTWVKKGEIPYFKTPGGRLRFKREAVLDFLRKYHFPIPPELAQGRATVIAVDDDPTWLTQVKRALSRSFDVQSYKDPYDALLAIGDQKPDAVVMDVRMPGVDGVHCIHRIRAWEDLRHTRIVVFSAYEDQQKACLEAGASAFVAKPATEELHNKLRHVLGQR